MTKQPRSGSQTWRVSLPTRRAGGRTGGVWPGTGTDSGGQHFSSTLGSSPQLCPCSLLSRCQFALSTTLCPSLSAQHSLPNTLCMTLWVPCFLIFSTPFSLISSRPSNDSKKILSRICRVDGHTRAMKIRTFCPRPAHGGQPTAHSGQPTAHGGQSTAHGGQPTAHGGQSTVHGGQPMAHGPR